MWSEERKAERSLNVHFEILQPCAICVVNTGRKQHKWRRNTHRQEHSLARVSLYSPLPQSSSSQGRMVKSHFLQVITLLWGMTAWPWRETEAWVEGVVLNPDSDHLQWLTFSGTQFPHRTKVHIVVLCTLLSLKFPSHWTFFHIAKKSFQFRPFSPYPSLVSAWAMEDV